MSAVAADNEFCAKLFNIAVPVDNLSALEDVIHWVSGFYIRFWSFDPVFVGSC